MEPTLTPPRHSELVEATLARVTVKPSVLRLSIVLRDPSNPTDLLTVVFDGVTALAIDADASLSTLGFQIVSKAADGWESPRYWVKSTDQGRIQFGCDAFDLTESARLG